MKQQLHFSLMVDGLKIECRDYGWSYAKMYVYAPRSSIWRLLFPWKLVFMTGGGKWSQYSADAECATGDTAMTWCNRAAREYREFQASWLKFSAPGAEAGR